MTIWAGLLVTAAGLLLAHPFEASTSPGDHSPPSSLRCENTVTRRPSKRRSSNRPAGSSRRNSVVREQTDVESPPRNATTSKRPSPTRHASVTDKVDRKKTEQIANERPKLDVNRLYDRFKRDETLPHFPADGWSTDHTVYESFRPTIHKQMGHVEIRFAKYTPIDGQLCVLKVFFLEKEPIVRQALTEIHVLAHVEATPFVVRLYHAYVANIPSANGTTRRAICVVTEYIPGMSLELAMRERRYRTNESFARAVVRCVSQAVGALHAGRFVHGDVKPENVILEDRHPVFYPKAWSGRRRPDDVDAYFTPDYSQQFPLRAVLIDPGFAVQLPDDDGDGSDDGTVRPTGVSWEYASPELIFKQVCFRQSILFTLTRINRAFDFWALGMTAYKLIAKRLPFDIRRIREEMTYLTPIQQKNYRRTTLNAMQQITYPIVVTAAGKAFINSLLHVDPRRRLGVSGRVEDADWMDDATFDAQHNAIIAPQQSQWKNAYT